MRLFTDKCSKLREEVYSYLEEGFLLEKTDCRVGTNHPHFVVRLLVVTLSATHRGRGPSPILARPTCRSSGRAAAANGRTQLLLTSGPTPTLYARGSRTGNHVGCLGATAARRSARHRTVLHSSSDDFSAHAAAVAVATCLKLPRRQSLKHSLIS